MDHQKMLIVDKSPELAEVLSSSVEFNEWSIARATSTEETNYQMAREGFQLILLNFASSPELSRNFTDNYRSLKRAAAIIVVAESKTGLPNDLYSYNITSTLFSPIDPMNLLRSLQAIKSRILLIDAEGVEESTFYNRGMTNLVSVESIHAARREIESGRADLIILGTKKRFHLNFVKWIRSHHSLEELPIVMVIPEMEHNYERVVSGYLNGINDIIEAPIDEVIFYCRIMNLLHIRIIGNKLKAAQVQAEESAKIKAGFLANMSHEIRTPLNGIVGMSSLLKTTKLSKEQAQYIEAMRSSSESLVALVNDILDFSKMESGKLDLEIVEFSLDDLVVECINLFENQINLSRTDLIAYIEPMVPPILVGDVGRIRQILNNLIGNAIKFTEDGHVAVSITLEHHAGRRPTIKFSVEDTGIGIESKTIPELFSPFTQADLSTTRRFGGTGLGLSICKNLVELMKGEIGVESELGTGSTFWFEIPLQQGSNINERDIYQSLRGLSVLIADHHPATRHVIHKICLDFGMQSVMVKTIDDFHLHVKSQRFDVVVLGFDLDSFEISRITADLGDSTPIKSLVMVSHEIVKNQVQDILRTTGVDEFISRPIRQREILNKMVRLIENKAPEPVVFESGVPSRMIGLSVLVVDDNSANQAVASKMLQKLGLLSDTVANGREAIEAWKTGAYSLILMDCQMPIMDGYEATRRLRKLEKNGRIPIIAMTANAMPGDREKCLGVGMDDYIAKPIKLETIKEVLAKWIPVLGEVKELSIMDKEALDTFNRMSADKHFLRDQISCIMAEATRELNKLHKAIRQADAHMLQSAIDQMKILTVYLGAEALTQSLETMAVNSEKSDLAYAQIKDELYHLGIELERYLEYLDSNAA